MMLKSTLKSTLLVTIAFVLLRISGFIREMVTAAIYGADIITDAFFVAISIPEILLSGAAGAICTVFIPQYQRYDGDKEQFFSNIVNLLALLSLLLSFIVTLKPQTLVFLFSSQLDSAAFGLAASFLRVIIWTSMPILLTAMFRSYLQIHGAFFVAQLAMLCNNLFIIIGIVGSYATGNLSFIPAGTVFGAIMYMVILMALIKKQGFKYQLYINTKDDTIKEMLHLLAPLMLSISVGELNQIISRNFASSLAVGSISALNYAAKIQSLFVSVIGVSIITVMYPKMSEMANQGNIKQLHSHVLQYLHKLLPILLPIAAAIIILAEPIVKILFERGAFTLEDTRTTVECLRMYSFGIIFVNIFPFLVKVFHSMRDTKTPAVISVISLCVTIVLNAILIGPIRHMGLALATSLSSLIMTCLLLFAIRKRFGNLGLMDMKTEWLKILGATVVTGFVIWQGFRILPVLSGGTAQCFFLTAALGIMGATVYILLHFILGTMFIKDCVKMVCRFLSEKSK